jgi:cytoskeleton protein RodZ
MTEPEPVEEAAAPDVGAPADPPAPEHFGATLRAAREAASISVPALAGRLRLHVRQIEAIERADLAALPSLIYVRGFVRSCARELRIDPEPLLADLNRRAGVEAGAPPATGATAFPLARFGDGSRPIIGIVLVVLVVAGVVGTLIPRRGSISTERAPAAGPAATGNGSSAAAPQPVLPDPSPAAPVEPAAPPAGEAAGAQPAATAPTAATQAAAGAPGPGVPKPAAAKADARAPRPAATGVPAPAAETDAGAGPASTGSPAATAAAPPAQDGPDLVLHVHAASWVEVVQSNGTTLLAQICAAGSVQEIKGKAPLRIVIGNATAVDAQYRGNPVDLTRYANVNGVARFTLE